jgi:hypothetical protein
VHVEGQGLRTKPEIVRQLTKYVFPRWNGRAIRDLRRIDIKDLERHISVNHGRTQAEAVLRTLRSLMTRYGEDDEDFRIPFAPRRRGQRSIEDRARSRYLDDEEIRQLWKACEQCGMYGTLTKCNDCGRLRTSSGTTSITTVSGPYRLSGARRDMRARSSCRH